MSFSLLNYSIHTEKWANHKFKSHLISIKWTTSYHLPNQRTDQKIEHCQHPRNPKFLPLTKESYYSDTIIEIILPILEHPINDVKEQTLLYLPSFAQYLWNAIMLLIEITYSFSLLCSICLWLYHHILVYFIAEEYLESYE